MSSGVAVRVMQAEAGSLVTPAELPVWLGERKTKRHQWRLQSRVAERAGLTGVLSGLVMAVFLADACAPSGIAMWLLYAIPLALSYQASSVKQPYRFAAASTALIFLAWFLAPPDRHGPSKRSTGPRSRASSGWLRCGWSAAGLLRRR